MSLNDDIRYKSGLLQKISPKNIKRIEQLKQEIEVLKIKRNEKRIADIIAFSSGCPEHGWSEIHQDGDAVYCGAKRWDGHTCCYHYEQPKFDKIKTRNKKVGYAANTL